MRTPWIAALTVLLLSLLPQTARRGAQEPTQDPKPKIDWRTNAETRAAYFTSELLGAWQLTKARNRGEIFTGKKLAGYALFTEGYMSLELHVQSDFSRIAQFQSGIHRWQIDSTADLVTSSLIGNSNFTTNADWIFEPRGAPRTYKVTISEGALTLKSTDGVSDLTFIRLGDLGFPGSGGGGALDFYGRKKPR